MAPLVALKHLGLPGSGWVTHWVCHIGEVAARCKKELIHICIFTRTQSECFSGTHVAEPFFLEKNIGLEDDSA